MIDQLYCDLHPKNCMFSNRFLATLILFAVTFSTRGQYHSIDFFISNADSVTISTVKYIDKTMVYPKRIKRTDTLGNCYYDYFYPPEINDSISIIGIKYLDTKETKNLIRKLRKVKKVYPLPTGYDIQLDFYKKNVLIQTATVSSYSKKLIVKKTGCKEVYNENNSEIDPCIFMGMISNDLKKYLRYLLIKKNLWINEDNFFEDL